MNAKPLISCTAFALTACSSYINPHTVSRERAARAEAFSHPLITRAFHAKPAIRFPATIAVAPQGSEAQEQLRALGATGHLDELKNLPQIAQIGPLSTLLLGDKAPNDLALREAAAKGHADALLLVSVNSITTDGKILAPLTALSLGLFPNEHYEIISTALAALVDVRTGYVYGTLERSAARSGLTTAWGDSLRAKNRAERHAMEKLLGEFPAFWQSVVQTHRR